LTAEVTSPQRAALRYLQPSVHLANRLAQQERHQGLAAVGDGPNGQMMPQGRVATRRALRGPTL